MGSELGTQATVAALVSFGLQWLKTSKYFPWITTETEKLNRWLAIVIAFLSGFGIYATWDHGTVSITGLTAANAYHALVRCIQQWTFQQAAYRTIVAPPLPGAVQDEERQMAAGK